MGGRLFQFEDFELDSAAFALRRGGNIVHLERIPMELLLLLAERWGQLVTRDEILERVWGKGVFLDAPNAINTAVRKIRRTLGDSAETPRLIITVPTKGYRFIAPHSQNAALPALINETEIGSDGSEAIRLNSPSAERRRLTALFCDLKNSAILAANLDPEEWRESVAALRRIATECIERFGGAIAQHLPDGVRSYFGWPEAHDNDAERAARASLAILEAASQRDERPQGQEFIVKIALHTGTVVVAGNGEHVDVFGAVPLVAAQVLDATAGGTVLVTGETHQLISGLFVFEDRSTALLKNIRQPIQLYRVIKPCDPPRRQNNALGRTLLVGREEESRILINRWERVLIRDGQVVLIEGDPGIGKTRLVDHFHEQIVGIPHTWIECEATPFYQNTPLRPVIEMLQQALHWSITESREERLAILEASLPLSGLKLSEAVPLIAPFFDIEASERYAPLLMSDEQQRRRLLAVLAEWLFGIAAAQPLVMVIGDLQWADPSTLALIQILVEQGAMSSLLLLCTARPEFEAQWPRRAHQTQISLNRLSPHETRELIEQLAPSEALPQETVAAIVERTGGVPLFAEELTKMVLECGDTTLTARRVPATLHDLLMSRLDRLGAAKEVAQIAAVIGSRFSYELLRLVHNLPDVDLRSALTKLAEAELVYTRGIPPEATYTFRHALIQDAAYDALLKTRRRELHCKIARIVNDQFAGFATVHPEVLARHWTEAGESELAMVEWLRAAKAAEGRNAFSEALKNYQQALAMLKLLPESSERNVRELKLLQSIVSMLYFTRGYSAAETIEATGRVTLLAEKTGNIQRLFGSVIARCLAALASGDSVVAAACADEALDLAQRSGRSTNLGFAYSVGIITSYQRGNLAGVEQQFEAGLPFFEDADFKKFPGAAITAFGGAGFNAWTLGRADVARERMARMMEAVKGNSPYDEALADYSTALFFVNLREYGKAEASASRALKLAKENQFPQIVALSQCILGHARAYLGYTTEGIGLIRSGIAGLRQSGTRHSIVHYTVSLAAAQDREGAIVDAIETVDLALLSNPEIVNRPAILRLRGELYLKRGQVELAENDFRQSIALARSIGAKTWELSAMMSCARLIAQQGKREKAHAILDEIYGWFTEGFDTIDLKDAKALLDELKGIKPVDRLNFRPST